jgi:hypothetical protein
MCKFFTIAVLLCLNTFANSQSITENTILGKWTVVKILKQKPDAPEFKMFSDMFRDAYFVFNKDYTFQLNSTKPNFLFAEFAKMTKDTRWRLNSKTNEILIGTKQDNYSTLRLTMKQKDEVTHIEMDEGEFYLLFEVKKG